MPKRGSRPPGFGVCSGTGVIGGRGRITVGVAAGGAAAGGETVGVGSSALVAVTSVALGGATGTEPWHAIETVAIVATTSATRQPSTAD